MHFSEKHKLLDILDGPPPPPPLWMWRSRGACRLCSGSREEYMCSSGQTMPSWVQSEARVASQWRFPLRLPTLLHEQTNFFHLTCLNWSQKNMFVFFDVRVQPPVPPSALLSLRLYHPSRIWRTIFKWIGTGRAARCNNLPPYFSRSFWFLFLLHSLSHLFSDFSLILTPPAPRPCAW